MLFVRLIGFLVFFVSHSFAMMDDVDLGSKPPSGVCLVEESKVEFTDEMELGTVKRMNGVLIHLDDVFGYVVVVGKKTDLLAKSGTHYRFSFKRGTSIRQFTSYMDAVCRIEELEAPLEAISSMSYKPHLITFKHSDAKRGFPRNIAPLLITRTAEAPLRNGNVLCFYSYLGRAYKGKKIKNPSSEEPLDKSLRGKIRCYLGNPVYTPTHFYTQRFPMVGEDIERIRNLPKHIAQTRGLFVPAQMEEMNGAPLIYTSHQTGKRYLAGVYVAHDCSDEETNRGIKSTGFFTSSTFVRIPRNISYSLMKAAAFSYGTHMARLSRVAESGTAAVRTSKRRSRAKRSRGKKKIPAQARKQTQVRRKGLVA